MKGGANIPDNEYNIYREILIRYLDVSNEANIDNREDIITAIDNEVLDLKEINDNNLLSKDFILSNDNDNDYMNTDNELKVTTLLNNLYDAASLDRNLDSFISEYYNILSKPDNRKHIALNIIKYKYISLFNKKILLKQLEELLKFITKTIGACYLRLQLVEQVKEKGRKLTKEFFKKVGGELFINSTEEMQQIEKEIIALYNLYDNNLVSGDFFKDPYIPKRPQTVHALILAFYFLGFVGLGAASYFAVPPAAAAVAAAGAGAFGLTAASVGTMTKAALPPAITGLGSVCTLFTSKTRENLKGSICRSWDTKIVMIKMRERFGIKQSEFDSCLGIVSNKDLKPIFDKIKNGINEYTRKVNKSYEIYNKLFIFLTGTMNENSQNKFRELPVEIPIDEIAQQFKSLNTEEVNNIIYLHWGNRTAHDKIIIQTYVSSITQLIENNSGFTCSEQPINNNQKLKNIYETIDRINSSIDMMNDLKNRLICRGERAGGSKRKTIKRKQIKKKNRKTYKHYL